MNGRSASRLFGLLLLVSGGPLGAQQPLTVDVGLTSVRFPEDRTVVAGPTIRASVAGVTDRSFYSFAAGGVATFNAASGFIDVGGGIRPISRGSWAGEVIGDLSGVSGSQRAGIASTGEAGLRSVWLLGRGSAWMSGRGHVSSRTRTSLNGAAIEAGASWRFDQSQLYATVRQEWTGAELFERVQRDRFVGTTPVRYTEGSVAYHKDDERTSIDISASARHDRDASRSIEPAFAVILAKWTSSRAGFVFSAARQLPDWVHGADAADFVSVGVRFRAATRNSSAPSRRAIVVLVSDGDSARTVSVRASGARTVEIMGDFTEWEPRALTQRGSVHEARLPISGGAHRIMVRIDGGTWIAPANTPSVDDEFGGKSGVLVVP